MTPSSPKDKSLYFQVTVPANDGTSYTVPSPVDGIMTGFTIRSQATTTDTAVSVVYSGNPVAITPATDITTSTTYRYDVESGQLPVVADGGQTVGGDDVLVFAFVNSSVQETQLFVRADFISAQ